MAKILGRYIVSYFMLKYSLYLHLGAHYFSAPLVPTYLPIVSIKIDYNINARIITIKRARYLFGKWNIIISDYIQIYIYTLYIIGIYDL